MRDIYFFFQQNLMVWNRIKSQKVWHSAEGHPAAQASAPTNAHRADLCKEVSLVKAISPWEATLPFHRGIWEWHITCTWFSCYLSNKNKYLTGMWHATSTAMACAYGHDANNKKKKPKKVSQTFHALLSWHHVPFLRFLSNCRKSIWATSVAQNHRQLGIAKCEKWDWFPW